MSQSPLTVSRAWFAGRRLTDAGCCRVSGLILVSVAAKAVYICARWCSVQLLTWAPVYLHNGLGHMCIMNVAAA